MHCLARNMTIAELEEEVADYMEFYNYQRFHESLEYKKSMDVYFKSLQANDECLEQFIESLVSMINLKKYSYPVALRQGH